MIYQEIYIPRYDWRVRVWYAVTGYHTQAIMMTLKEIRCDKEHLKDAMAQLTNGGLNSGLTYSNYKMRESVVVTALTSSAKEFGNSLAHERRHLVTHIAQANGIALDGEEICYLDGWLAAKMMEKCKVLLCDCCRDPLIRQHNSRTP